MEMIVVNVQLTYVDDEGKSYGSPIVSYVHTEEDIENNYFIEDAVLDLVQEAADHLEDIVPDEEAPDTEVPVA